MKDTDFNSILEFKNVAGKALIPVSQKAQEMVQQNTGKIIAFKEVTARDLTYHRAYFGLLRFIWLHLPQKFQDAVPQSRFYQWLKHAQGKYKILYEFKEDGSKFIEYESISFARMSQAKFRDYVKLQLAFIYEYVIRKVYDSQSAAVTIEIIEDKWEGYLERI